MSLNFLDTYHLTHLVFKEENISCKWPSSALGFLLASLKLRRQKLDKATKDRLLIYNKLSQPGN